MLPLRFRDRLPLLISIIFATVLVAPLALYYQPSGCTLEIWSSQEKSKLLQSLANSYNASGADRPCSVSVDEVKSGTAEHALATGWRAAGKPRPDVWSPAASTWAELFSQDVSQSSGQIALPGTGTSIAHSPLVIAMPVQMASAMGWPVRQLAWADVLALGGQRNAWANLGHPEWGAFKLGQTDPTVSTSGLHAFIGIFSAAVEARDGNSLPAPLTTTDVSDPRVLDFVSGVESRVGHYTDTVATFTDQLRNAGDLTYVSAVAMEEQEVWSYNTTGDPKVRLAAIYPREGSLFADHPYLPLVAPWMDEAKRAAAAGFLGFVLSRAQQQSFQKHGFRDGSVPYAVPDDTVINQRNGLLPTQPAVTLSQPAPAVLQKIEQAWPSVH